MSLFTSLFSKTIISLVAIGWMFLGIETTVIAQQPSGKQTGSATRTQVSDAELRAFVKAYVETQNIRREYEPPLQKTTDPDKTQDLQKEANAELKETLAKQNLTVAQYNRIFSAVNNDPRLREKTLKLVEAERQRSNQRSR